MIVVFANGQRFKQTGTRKHVTKNGKSCKIIILKSYCPECGSKFETTSTRKQIKQRSIPTRRCKRCAKPGQHIDKYRSFGLD